MRLRRLPIEAMGLVLALVLVVSCGGAAGTPTPTPPPPLEILQTAYEVGQAVTTVHFDMDAKEKVQAEGQTLSLSMKFVGDLVSPDRLKGAITLNYLGQTVTTETIVIGTTAYAKDPTTGTWQSSTQEQMGLNPEQLIGLKPEQFQDLKLVGQENFNGRPTYHLSGKADLELSPMQGFDMAASDMLVNYWIDRETSHVLKATVTGQVSATFTGIDATVDIDLTMLLSDYGKAVTIEPPM